MISIRHERHSDFDAREALLDQAFGDTRARKSSERLREDRLPAEGLAFIATEARRVVGTARLWNIGCGNDADALLLGPVAVSEGRRSQGIGAALVRRALRDARHRGYAAVILVGDEPYYSRFGFGAAKTGALWMPGPYERHRLLAVELIPGALDGARGLINATGRFTPKPDLAALVAQDRRALRARRHQRPVPEARAA